MESRNRRVVALLLILSLLLAFLGQHYFAKKRDFMWDGILIYAVAMMAFAWVISRVEGREGRASVVGVPGLWRGIWQELHCNAVRLAFLIAGVGLVVYVSAAAGSRPGNKPFYDLLAMWGAGIAAVVGAFVDWQGFPRRVAQTWSRLTHAGPEVAFVVVIAIVTFLVRGVKLEQIPFVIRGDEAALGLQAVSVLEGRITNPFATGWLSHPTLFFFLQAIFVRAFGITTAAVRLSSALISVPLSVLLYLFARRFYGRWVAVLSALLFAGYHYALHYGRIGLNNIWDPFFGLATFYFLSVGLEDKRLGHVLAGGVLTGLAAYFYMGARLIPIILVVYLLYRSLRERDFWREKLVYLVVFGLLALITALPLLAHFRAHPSNLMARWEWLGIFPSGWVDAEVQRTGKSVMGVLLGQFLKAVLAFNYHRDPTFFYRPGMPLLRFFTSVFFVFGLAYAIAHWRRRQYSLLVMWFLLVICFGGMLLENPPASPRLVLAIPPVVICVALGMVKISQSVRAVLDERRGVALALSLVLVLIGSYQSLHFYFGEYTPKHMYSDWNDEVCNRLGKYLRVLGPQYQCYLLGAPRIYYGHPPIPFLAQGVTGVDVVERVQDKIEFVNPSRDAVFVFLPERRAEFDVVRRLYPVGSFREFRNPKGRLLFVAYEVDI